LNCGRWVKAFEQRVDVRKDDADRRGFIIIIHEEHQTRVCKGLHTFLNVPHLISSQGDKTPVAGPGVIIYLPDQVELSIHFLRINVPDADTFFLSSPFSKTLHPIGQPVLAIYQEGQQVLLFGEAARFD